MLIAKDDLRIPTERLPGGSETTEMSDVITVSTLSERVICRTPDSRCRTVPGSIHPEFSSKPSATCMKSGPRGTQAIATRRYRGIGGRGRRHDKDTVLDERAATEDLVNGLSSRPARHAYPAALWPVVRRKLRPSRTIEKVTSNPTRIVLSILSAPSMRDKSVIP